MIEQELGTLNITPNQLKHLSNVHDNRVKGIVIRDGVYYAYVENELNNGQKTALINAINNLPDEKDKLGKAQDKIKEKNKNNLSDQDVKDIVVALAEIQGLL